MSPSTLLSPSILLSTFIEMVTKQKMRHLNDWCLNTRWNKIALSRLFLLFVPRYYRLAWATPNFACSTRTLELQHVFLDHMLINIQNNIGRMQATSCLSVVISIFDLGGWWLKHITFPRRPFSEMSCAFNAHWFFEQKLKNQQPATMTNRMKRLSSSSTPETTR